MVRATPRIMRFAPLRAFGSPRLLLLLSILLACCGYAAGDVGGDLVAATEALEQGHYQQAAALARAVDRADPGNVMAGVVRASVQLAEFDVAAAQQGFGQALRADPALASAWLGSGACAVREGDFAAAARMYRAALAADCHLPARARSSLAYVLCQAGDLPAASREIEALREGWALTPLAIEVEAAIRIADRDLTGALEVLAEAALAVSKAPQLVMSPVTVPLSLPNASTRVLAALSGREPACAGPGPTALRPAAVERVEEQGLHIVAPTPGATVSGSIQVSVQAERGVALSYLALLVDGKFRAMSNAVPYRLTLDTHTCTDGPHELRVDGYGPAGLRAAWATRMVVVANGSSAGVRRPPRLGPRHTDPADTDASAAEAGHRTYAPGQARLLTEAERQLEAWLTLQPHPLNRAYLAGRVREAQGRRLEAAAAYEYVFAVQPAYPGVHADLLAAYRKLGLTGASKGPLERRHLPAGSRSVALTFDDGPSPSLTPAILDELDRYGAKATFFVIGKQAELYPDLVRAIHERGHELACHSYSHADMTELSVLELERELVKTRAVVREASGALVTYFRPPGGHYDADVRWAAAQMGYHTIFWSANIGDCAGMEAEAAARRLLADIDDGAIVLLHNGYDETVPALPKLLAALHQRGFKMRTISQILGRQPLAAAVGPEGVEGAAAQ